MLTKEKVQALQADGFSLIDIAKKHKIPAFEVVALLSDKPLFPETKVIDVEVMPASIEKVDPETELKDKVHSVAMLAVGRIKDALDEKHIEPIDLTKLADSVAKMHTTFFKSDAGTVVNIQTAALNQFRGLLKE